MLLTRLITRTGARLLAVARAVVLLLDHTIGSTSPLGYEGPSSHNPVWAAPEPAALPTPPSHA